MLVLGNEIFAVLIFTIVVTRELDMWPFPNVRSEVYGQFMNDSFVLPQWYKLFLTEYV